MTKEPIFAIHRRNRIDQISSIPKGCWVEIDVEIYDGQAWMTHDPLSMPPSQIRPVLSKLEEYVPIALSHGIAGFVVDCKRENAERFVRPILEKYDVSSYFYLNEMEVQADIFQELNRTHSTGIRVWKYRNAEDVVRLAQDMEKIGQASPQWVWFDCWQRGLLDDIDKAYVPMTGDQARALQRLGVKLCICSPELYVHKYDTVYDSNALAAFYRGTVAYRAALAKQGIVGDLYCSKFPDLWKLDLALLQKAGTALGVFDFTNYGAVSEKQIRALL